MTQQALFLQEIIKLRDKHKITLLELHELTRIYRDLFSDIPAKETTTTNVYNVACICEKYLDVQEQGIGYLIAARG